MRSLKFNGGIDRVGNNLYPWLCNVCLNKCNDRAGVCAQCYPLLPWCNSVCSICGLAISVDSQHQYMCGECQQRRPHFDHLFAPLWYEPPISQFIVDYKYSNRLEYAQLLMDLFMSKCRMPNCDALLIPVPSHPTRIRERGFNAVYELTRVFRQVSNIDYATRRIKRTLITDTQNGKSRRERRRNVKNAFKVIKKIEPKKVILFDDVVTTSATVNELSKCIKKQGVETVEVWAIARTRQNMRRK